MCQIIVGKADNVMELLAVHGVAMSLYDNNRDGVGLMYRRDGKCFSTKHLPKTYKDMANWLNANVPEGDTEIALHFRMATHGDICHENVHPYPVTGGGLLMHNGVLHGFGTPLTAPKAGKQVRRSDTFHFIEQRLHPLLSAVGWGGLADLQEKIGNEIGKSNRLVYLSPVPGESVQIVNRHTGLEHPSGVWFANSYSFDADLLFPQERPYWASMYEPDDMGYARALTNEVWDAIDSGDYETLYELASTDLDGFIKALLN